MPGTTAKNRDRRPCREEPGDAGEGEEADSGDDASDGAQEDTPAAAETPGEQTAEAAQARRKPSRPSNNGSAACATNRAPSLSGNSAMRRSGVIAKGYLGPGSGAALVKPLLSLALLVLATLGASALADLTAETDREVIDENDVLRLTLRIDEQIFIGEPDFAPSSKISSS